MNEECPFCGSDNAYHNGDCYICPDCDSEWEDDIEFDDDENEIEGYEPYPFK